MLSEAVIESILDDSDTKLRVGVKFVTKCGFVAVPMQHADSKGRIECRILHATINDRYKDPSPSHKSWIRTADTGSMWVWDSDGFFFGYELDPSHPLHAVWCKEGAC